MSHLVQFDVDVNDPAFLYLNLHTDEEIKVVVRRHWAGFLGTIAISLAMAIFPVLVIILSHYVFDAPSKFTFFLVVLVASYYLFLLTFIFGAWINYYYDIIFITSERLLNVAQEGLLSRQVSELSLGQVQNVSAEVSGFIQNYFNYGHLVVETAGEGSGEAQSKFGLQGYFTIPDLPDPNRLARIILELHRSIHVKEKL